MRPEIRPRIKHHNRRNPVGESVYLLNLAATRTKQNDSSTNTTTNSRDLQRVWLLRYSSPADRPATPRIPKVLSNRCANFSVTLTLAYFYVHRVVCSLYGPHVATEFCFLFALLPSPHSWIISISKATHTVAERGALYLLDSARYLRIQRSGSSSSCPKRQQ